MEGLDMDDRMKKDEQRPGGQQTPGRNPKDQQSGGQFGQQQGGQKKDNLNMDDEDEFGGGTSGQRGGQGQGQGRGGQNR
jgi:hypothetical protein